MKNNYQKWIPSDGDYSSEVMSGEGLKQLPFDITKKWKILNIGFSFLMLFILISVLSIIVKI